MSQEGCQSIVCPVCHTNNPQLLFSQTAQEILDDQLVPGDPRREPLLRILESETPKEGIAFLTCRRCGFGFADPFRPASQDFYEVVHSTNQSYTPWKWDYEVTIEALKRMSIRGDLLELGAGCGYFVEAAVKSMFDPDHIVCTEYSPAGRARLEAMGIHTCNNDLIELPETLQKRFDVICGFQIIEHMSDPHRVFKTLHKLCAPDGHVFLATPNHMKRDYLDTLGVHQDNPPSHIARFTEESFKLLANASGFKLVEFKHQPTTRKQFFILMAKTYFSRFKNRGASSRLCKLKYLVRSGFLALRTALAPQAQRMGISQWAHLVRNDV